MTNVQKVNEVGTAPLPPERIQDPLRPAYHFTAPSNWLNDPNGLIQWKGTYHLFYQYTPDSPLSGLKHWGHASSTDLVRWQDHPIAISPTLESPDEDGIYSGCAIDANGTPMAFYSGVRGPNQLVCRATSDDRLVSWHKDPANPVVGAAPEGLDLVTTDDGTIHYRDPSVWREDDAWWMTVGTGITGVGGSVLLYRSDNLSDWAYVGPILTGDARKHEPVWTGTVWECPQLFPLGDHHVLLISVWAEETTLYTAYMVGTYRDQRFTPEHVAILDPGSFYAPQTFLDERSRRIMFGWLREQRSCEAMTAAGWNGAMTIPWELSLGDDNRLRYRPVAELQALRRDHRRIEHLEVAPASSATLEGMRGDSLEIEASISQQSASEVGLVLCRSPDGREATRIIWNPETNTLAVDKTKSSLDESVDTERHEVPLDLQDGEPLCLKVFLDRTIIEIVANERVMLTERIYPTLEDSLGVAVYAESGYARVDSMDCWRLAVE